MAAADSFWARVDRSGDCWEWSGRRGQQHYGQLWFEGQPKRAHRVAWELTNGPIPVGFDVLHRCDNPPCVNPSHLFLGTRADNNRDRDAKGRTARGERHGTHTHPESYRGERHRAVKLTEAQVRDIRARHAGGATKLGLAREYGVSRRAVRSLLAGESWGWLS